MTNDEFRLRPEARSVPTSDLAPDQLRAFEALVDLLHAASRDLPNSGEWHRDALATDAFDEARTSRVIFLGGDRGSGKTTVARTLLSELGHRGQPRYGSPFDRAPASGADADPDQERTRKLQDLEQKVGAIRSKVILLEPLGMENAPAETNILAALLSRIERCLFPDLSQEDVATTTGQPHRHQAVLELLRLQTDVAIAWNGNLSSRKGQLDPDNYAMEELRVERVRLQLRDRFTTVLRRTARDSLDHPNPAMFLLVVDDVDLNPGQILDLVDRLRMVGVAELVVLLVGDMQVLETVFRLHFARRFQLGGSVGPESIGMARSDMDALTNGLAQAALRKHIPFHQRVQLNKLTPREALEVSPLHGHRRTLAELLDDDRCALSWPTEVPAPPDEDGPFQAAGEMTLREFIHPSMSETDAVTSWYSGHRVLADFPRVTIDLWNALYDASNRPALDTAPDHHAGQLDHRLLRLLGGIAVERLEANTELEGAERQLFDSGMRRRLTDEGDLSALNLRAAHVVPNERELWAGSVPAGDDSDRSVVWVRHGGLAFEVFAPRPGSGFRLTTDQAGALVLVEDLWSTQAAAPSSETVSSRHRDALAWVVERPGDGSNGSGSQYRWPIPRYRLVRQIEQFGYGWNNFLDSVSGDDLGVRDLAVAWLMLHTETLVGERPVTFDDSSSSLVERQQDNVGKLERLEAIAERGVNNWQKVTAADWLASVRAISTRYGEPGSSTAHPLLARYATASD